MRGYIKVEARSSHRAGLLWDRTSFLFCLSVFRKGRGCEEFITLRELGNSKSVNRHIPESSADLEGHSLYQNWLKPSSATYPEARRRQERTVCSFLLRSLGNGRLQCQCYRSYHLTR